MICEAVEVALVARLEHDEEARRCWRSCAPPVLPVCEANAGDVGIGEDAPRPISRCSRIISSGETSCAPSEMPEITPVSWIGKKPLGIVIAMHDGQRHGGEEHAERDRLVAQHDIERAPIERHHGVEPGLDDAIDAAVLIRRRAA